MCGYIPEVSRNVNKAVVVKIQSGEAREEAQLFRQTNYSVTT